MLNQLIKSIGLPIRIRNFMVDYVDKEGNCYHKPMQTMDPTGIAQQSDEEIIKYIHSTLQNQGYRVSGIMEAEGEYEMNELDKIFNDAASFGRNVRPLFLDPALVFGGPAAR